jgi:hypothetical protein
VVDTTVGRQPLVHPENVIRPVAVAVLAWLAWTRSPRWHGTLGIVTAGLLLVFTSVTYVNEGL